MTKSVYYVVRSIVIAVCVSDDSQTRKAVLVPQNGSGLHSVPRVPNSKPVSEQVFCRSRHLESDLKLPIACVNRLKPGQFNSNTIYGAEFK